MTYLILGLILFLGVHSVRIVADDWRTRTIARIGHNPWKGVYALIAIAGFVLIVWGYGQARVAPVVLYQPPLFMYHLTSLLTLLSFVLVAAAYVPRNHIKARLGHPMLAGAKLWAFGHLLSNGMLADVILFGAILAWSIVSFLCARRRDRAAGTSYPAGSVAGTVATVVIGAAAWAAFAMWLHLWLIGVRPIALGPVS
jgi:uncharacterized membrane protein